MRRFSVVILLFYAIFAVAGCGTGPAAGEETATVVDPSEIKYYPHDFIRDPYGEDAPPGGFNDDWQISIVNDAGDELRRLSEVELFSLPSEQDFYFAYVYSTINNWPTARFYAAEGYSVTGFLRALGLADAVMAITFRAEDGYEITLTREQLFSEQYYFPQVGEDAGGAEPVFPMIAYRWREGTDNLDEIRDDKPIFIFGQRNPFEHTNPAFVVGVSEIVVSSYVPEAWQEANTFPEPGFIEAGETVKLQHTYFGLVKLYYTLDGSDPTMFSTLYNPSTYQQELNRPIPITEPTTIKVLVIGYGRRDSEIAVFEFWPEE